jgi:hypothetical protein
MNKLVMTTLLFAAVLSATALACATPVTWSDWTSCNGFGQIGTQTRTSSIGQTEGRTCILPRGNDGLFPNIGTSVNTCKMNTYITSTYKPKLAMSICWYNTPNSYQQNWIKSYGNYVKYKEYITATTWKYKITWWKLQ